MTVKGQATIEGAQSIGGTKGGGAPAEARNTWKQMTEAVIDLFALCSQLEGRGTIG